MPALLLVLCGCFAVATAVVLFLLLRDPAPSMSERIAALDRSHGVESRQGVFTRFVDDQQQRLLGSRFLEAGWYDMTAARFIVQSLIGGAVGFMAGAAIVLVLHAGLMVQLFIGFVLCFAGFYYPTSRLDAAIKARKIAVARSVPDFLDMVCSTVQAGIAINGAIAIAAEGIDGALAEELRLTLQDIRLGRSRVDALTAMAARVKESALSATVTAIVQVDRLGGDIASVLESLAHDARENRLMRAEELANALPNKLVLPMALFMLPSLFVVIFGSLIAHMIAPR